METRMKIGNAELVFRHMTEEETCGPPEFSIMFELNGDMQDVVLVRKAANPNGGPLDDEVDVFVYANENEEDYTNKFTIPVNDALGF